MQITLTNEVKLLTWWQRRRRSNTLGDAGFWFCLQIHRRRHRRAGGPWPPWIFMHRTDKAEIGLMVLFFGLVFYVSPPIPWNFFCRRPCTNPIKFAQISL